MAKTPHLHRRGPVYYFRRKVPLDLVGAFGKREVSHSLKTKERGEALRLLALADVEWNERFDSARRKLRTKRATSLTDAEAHQLVIRWFWCDEQAGWRIGESILSREEVLLESGEDIANMADPDDPGTLAVVQKEADSVLAEAHVALDKSGIAYASFVELLRRAMLESARRRRAGLLNDHAAAFDSMFQEQRAGVPEPETPQAPGVTLDELCRAYTDAPDRQHVGAKARTDYEVIFRALRELLGQDKPVRSINRADCREVRDVLSRLPPNATKRFRGMTLRQAADAAQEQGLEPMQPATANGYLNKLSALFKWAVREEYMDKNPAEALRVSEPETARRDARRPFSNEQLTKIFNAPLYTGCKDDGLGYSTPGARVVRRGRFWVPLVSLFTGMRLSEVCQLEVADVQVIDGVHCVVVTAEGDGDGKRLKTGSARRVIPMHPELRRIGFLRHARAMHRAGETRLFPELKTGSDGYYSDPFSKWFSRFLRNSGATASRTSFHSFRHGFRDALREAGVDREAVLALGGWAGNGGSEDDYGGGLRPKTLLRWMRKVRYPGLDLSHLHIE